MRYNFDRQGPVFVQRSDGHSPVILKPGIHAMDNGVWDSIVKKNQVVQTLLSERKLQMLSKEDAPIHEIIDVSETGADELLGLIEGIFDIESLRKMIEKESARIGAGRKQVLDALEYQIQLLKLR